MTKARSNTYSPSHHSGGVVPLTRKARDNSGNPINIIIGSKKYASDNDLSETYSAAMPEIAPVVEKYRTLLLNLLCNENWGELSTALNALAQEHNELLVLPNFDYIMQILRCLSEFWRDFGDIDQTKALETLASAASAEFDSTHSIEQAVMLLPTINDITAQSLQTKYELQVSIPLTLSRNENWDGLSIALNALTQEYNKLLSHHNSGYIIKILQRLSDFWQEFGDTNKSDELKTMASTALAELGEHNSGYGVTGLLRPMSDITPESLQVKHALHTPVLLDLLHSENWGRLSITLNIFAQEYNVLLLHCTDLDYTIRILQRLSNFWREFGDTGKSNKLEALASKASTEFDTTHSVVDAIKLLPPISDIKSESLQIKHALQVPVLNKIQECAKKETYVVLKWTLLWSGRWSSEIIDGVAYYVNESMLARHAPRNLLQYGPDIYMLCLEAGCIGAPTSVIPRVIYLKFQHYLGGSENSHPDYFYEHPNIIDDVKFNSYLVNYLSDLNYSPVSIWRISKAIKVQGQDWFRDDTMHVGALGKTIKNIPCVLYHKPHPKG